MAGIRRSGSSPAAQAGNPFESAVLGTYLHGLAGDMAAEEVGIHSLIAGDILAFLPYAFMKRNLS